MSAKSTVVIEILENVLRVLKPLTYEQFDLHLWRRTEGFSNGGCGTIACAIGWCANDPWFVGRGLTLAVRSEHHGTTFFYPTYQGRTGLDAVRYFMHLGKSDLDYAQFGLEFFLFAPQAYEENEDMDSGDHISVERVTQRISHVIRLLKGLVPLLPSDNFNVLYQVGTTMDLESVERINGKYPEYMKAIVRDFNFLVSN